MVIIMTVPQIKKKKELNVNLLIWDELTWLDIERPTDKEAAYLSEHYSFHPLDLDDILSRIQRPKIDEYKDYLFLVFHFPIYRKWERVLTSSQVSVFIGQNYLITIHEGELKPLVKLFRECQIDEGARQEYFSQGSGFLLYHILDRLIDYCLPILGKVGSSIGDVETDIFSDSKRSIIREISMIRRDIISFRRIIWPMRAVIGSLEPRVSRFVKKTDLSVYFGDMIDHADKIWDGLDEYKEIIEGLNDTHDSLATNRTNEVVRMLTIIATILLPITVVASIFGMNIPLGPFEVSGYSFLLVSLIMLGVIGGMLYFFRRIHVI
jgi:magnesium transporter